MTEPMSDENLAELRSLHERATRDYSSELHYRRLAFHAWIPDLLAEVERSRRGGKELGKTVVFLAELIKDTYRRGETDPIGAVLALGHHLAELFEDEGGLPTDEHNRIYRTLENKHRAQAGRDRLAEQVKRVRQLMQPNDLNGGRTPAWVSVTDLRTALGETEAGQ